MAANCEQNARTAMFELFFLIIWFASSSALFEDQVGKFDWRLEYIGKPEHFKILPTSRKIIVATEANVLASLIPRNGDIGWRQIQEMDEVGHIEILTGNDDHLVTVNDGGFIRTWDVNSGFLKSEVFLKRETQNIVKSYYQLINENSELVIIEISSEAIIFVTKYNASSGLEIQTDEISSSWNRGNTDCHFTSASIFACVDHTTNFLHVLKMDEEASIMVIPFSALVPGPTPFIEIVPLSGISSKEHSYFALRLDSKDILLLNIESGSVKIERRFSQKLNLDIVESNNGLMLFAVAKEHTSNQLQFQVINMETGEELSNVISDIHLLNNHGKPQKMCIFSVPRKEGGFAYRALLVFEDHTVILVQNSGKILWTREESLSSVINVEMVDLPLSDSDAQFEQEFRSGDANVFKMLVKRITTQLLQLETFLITVLSGLQPKDPINSAGIDGQQLTRDEFNLHKIILLLTKPGKIFGMDSLTGQIIWSQYIPEMIPFEAQGDEKLLLFIQRTTAYFPLDPQAIVIGQNKLTGKGLVYPFDPIKGMPLSNEAVPLDFEIAQAVLLPQADKQYLRPVLFLDTKKQVYVYPSSGHEVAKSLSKSLFLFQAEVETGVLTGYSLAYSKQELLATPIWEVYFPPSTQTVTHVVLKRSNEHVHSQGRVMGDRSVMYKYLNPNLAAVLTRGMDTQQKPFFNIFLLDAVTGNIVYSASHKRCRGPVHVVHSENWIVYTYHSEKSRRSEMAVLELYEGKWQSNSTAFSSLHPPQSPMVERQAYIFPPGLNAAAVTITEKGITSKFLLFALPSGGILELPKALLDPRRPLIPTQEHREEGIYPYTPELPIPSENIINYNQSIQNVRAIYTAPAGLESTCLVLAYGLDLFYTRITPSRTFDVLKDDFDHYLISAVLLALILASYLTRRLAARKALQQAWK